MLHWGQPEVKTLMNILPAQPVEGKKMHYACLVCCVYKKAVGEKEWGTSPLHISIHRKWQNCKYARLKGRHSDLGCHIHQMWEDTGDTFI